MASVYQRTAIPTRRPALLAPGEIVWARVFNPCVNPSSRGKSRPVILLEPAGSAWHVLGLTTNPRLRDGSPRIAIPDPWSVGLRRPGWIWSNRPTRITALDIDDHAGWVDHALANAIIAGTDVSSSVAQGLLAAADQYHRSAGGAA